MEGRQPAVAQTTGRGTNGVWKEEEDPTAMHKAALRAVCGLPNLKSWPVSPSLELDGEVGATQPVRVLPGQLGLSALCLEQTQGIICSHFTGEAIEAARARIRALLPLPTSATTASATLGMGNSQAPAQ